MCCEFWCEDVLGKPRSSRASPPLLHSHPQLSYLGKPIANFDQISGQTTMSQTSTSGDLSPKDFKNVIRPHPHKEPLLPRYMETEARSRLRNFSNKFKNIPVSGGKENSQASFINQDQGKEQSSKTIVTKGFGNFPPPKQAVLAETHKFYPPRPNAGYLFGYSRTVDPDPVDITKSWTPSLDGLAPDKHQVGQETLCDEDTSPLKHPTIGERSARLINWGTRPFVSSDDPESINPVPNLSGNRATFVKDIDDALDRGENPFMFCEGCKQRHIPWGPPVTLGDRDTCLSMLPEWFPARNYHEPWDMLLGSSMIL